MNRPLFPPPSVARDFGHTDDQRRDRAHALALAIVRESAAEASEKIVAIRRREHEAGVDRMVAQPWRITRIVYGGFAPSVWPAGAKTAVEVLADCCRLIRTQERQRDLDRWTYDGAWVRDLRMAEDALVRIIMGAEPDGQEAA